MRWIIARLLASTAFALLVWGIAIRDFAYTHVVKPGNTFQYMRLPWHDGTTHNRSGFGASEGPTGHGPGAVDFSLVLYEDVLSVSDGTVVNAVSGGGAVPGFVEVRSSWDSTWITRYYHLCNRFVSTGDEVVQGEVIGEAGNTGNVIPAPAGPRCNPNEPTGEHLHFDFLDDGVEAAWDGSPPHEDISNTVVSDFGTQASGINHDGKGNNTAPGTGPLDSSPDIRQYYLDNAVAITGSTTRTEPQYRPCGVLSTRGMRTCGADGGITYDAQAFRDFVGSNRKLVIDNPRAGGPTDGVFRVASFPLVKYTQERPDPYTQPWAYYLGAPTGEDNGGTQYFEHPGSLIQYYQDKSGGWICWVTYEDQLQDTSDPCPFQTAPSTEYGQYGD